MKNSRGRINNLISFKFDRLLKTFKDELTRVYVLINKLNFTNYAALQNNFNIQ